MFQTFHSTLMENTTNIIIKDEKSIPTLKDVEEYLSPPKLKKVRSKTPQPKCKIEFILTAKKAKNHEDFLKTSSLYFEANYLVLKN